MRIKQLESDLEHEKLSFQISHRNWMSEKARMDMLKALLHKNKMRQSKDFPRWDKYEPKHVSHKSVVCWDDFYQDWYKV